MISFIKNLFSGILSFFIGLFGGKKVSGKTSSTNFISRKKEATTSSAEKLKEATAKTSSGSHLP